MRRRHADSTPSGREYGSSAEITRSCMKKKNQTKEPRSRRNKRMRPRLLGGLQEGFLHPTPSDHGIGVEIGTSAARAHHGRRNVHRPQMRSSRESNPRKSSSRDLNGMQGGSVSQTLGPEATPRSGRKTPGGTMSKLGRTGDSSRTHGGAISQQRHPNHGGTPTRRTRSDKWLEQCRWPRSWWMSKP